MMEKHFIQYNIVVSLMKTKSKNDKNPVLTYSVSTGFNVNMVFFVSLQKLLFTHKPLDTSDKGVQV
jgi:hypothetical protein